MLWNNKGSAAAISAFDAHDCANYTDVGRNIKTSVLHCVVYFGTNSAFLLNANSAHRSERKLAIIFT